MDDPPRRRADRLVQQRPAAARRRHAAGDLPHGEPRRPASPAPRPASSSRWIRRSWARSSRAHRAEARLRLVLRRAAGAVPSTRRRSGSREQLGTFKALGAPVLVYAETTGSVQNEIDAGVCAPAAHARRRFPRLWPQADRARRMDGRRRRGHDLSPPHGHGRRDRARDRSADGQYRAGGRPAARHRPSHLCRRRCRSRRRGGTAAASTTSTARTSAPRC